LARSPSIAAERDERRVRGNLRADASISREFVMEAAGASAPRRNFDERHPIR
jgi:hypothetical protein